MRTATLAQCQSQYDNASDPRLEDDSDVTWEKTEGIAHTEIVEALTAGRDIGILCNDKPYRVDSADVCELLNPKVMLTIAALIREGDQIEASRAFSVEWARAIHKCAENNAPFRAEWNASA